MKIRYALIHLTLVNWKLYFHLYPCTTSSPQSFTLGNCIHTNNYEKPGILICREIEPNVISNNAFRTFFQQAGLA